MFCIYILNSGVLKEPKNLNELAKPPDLHICSD